MAMRRFAKTFWVAFLTLVFCADLRAECNRCEPSSYFATEVGLNMGADNVDLPRRALAGVRLCLYDIDAEGARQYRLYGLGVDAVSVGGKRDVYGLQGGFVSSCSHGSGLSVGFCGFVSDYIGVEIGVLNVFNADDRQFFVQSVTGIQIGAINMNCSGFALQIGLVNTQSLEGNGFATELGLCNLIELDRMCSTALQFGFWNGADVSFRDDFVFQIGIVNWLEYGYGQGLCVQVGFLNMKKQRFNDEWSVLPLVSVSM